MTYEWLAQFGGESGLVLITDADAFRDWTGAVYDDDYRLDPDCDYARLMAVVFADDDEVEAAAIDAGIVWQMEDAGIAEVATGDRGLLIMRSWADDSGEPARAFAAGSAGQETEVTAGELQIASGRVAVVWAPVAGSDATLRGTQIDCPGMLNLGTVVPLPPGRYTAAYGSHEDDGWSCRWIRFDRQPGTDKP
ncbi:MAG TPA: hypothetical protein VN408_27735 [Actinoplanes sp.]|nr:hypothetical protein [Actinoplanes sp.]